MRLLALLLLVACESIPDRNRRLTVVQCSPNFKVETVEVLRDGVPVAETIMDLRRSECYCRRYRYSLGFMGPIADSTVTRPIMECDRLVGNPPQEYTKVVNFLEDLRKDLEGAQ